MHLSDEAIKQIRSWALKRYRMRTDAPVMVIEGDFPPRRNGTSYRYETKTGKPVYYPNAYRRAWGKPIYIPSSIIIEVGKKWAVQLEKDILHVRLCRQNKRFVSRSVVDFIFNFA
jgi:hypothetical protein